MIYKELSKAAALYLLGDDFMAEIKTAVIKLQDIKPAEYNPRVQLGAQDSQYQALSGSIRENGLVLPLIVNSRDNTLISGHQRLNVLLAAGETETTAVLVDMLPAQAKALALALNKLDGVWDYGKVADILQELAEQQSDLTATGFTSKEIGELLGDLAMEIGEETSGMQPERLAKKTDKSGLVKCFVGEFKFTLTENEFADLLAEVREKVGFTQLLVCEEIKRRLFA